MSTYEWQWTGPGDQPKAPAVAHVDAGTDLRQLRGPTLTDFLLARIAEDEAAVHAGPDYVVHELSAQLEPATGPDDAPVGYNWTGEFGDDLSLDPARVLAECEAKRRIIEWHRKSQWVEEQGYVSDYAQGELAAYRTVLLAIALPYADHPDHRDEWRP